jgi:hypothetical protein
MKNNDYPPCCLLSAKGGVILVLGLVFQAQNLTAAMIGLGAAETFAVLAGSTVTNTGPSVISGDLGVSPGSAVTGMPPGLVVNGTIHAAAAAALQAQSDLTTAYNAAAGLPYTQNLTGQDLGGMTLVPGIYFFSSSAQLTGNLRLNLLGNPDSLFVFQIGSTLTTASNSSVSLINAMEARNVFFQIGSSATLGTDTDFTGNILALTSITLNTGASIDGRALARNGAVTLDNNVITASNSENAHSVPDGGSTLMLLASAMGIVVWVAKKASLRQAA